MKKLTRANKIQAILDTYYPNPKVPLHHKDPYTLLIAVLLSARCTDARVNQVTPSLFALADTPETMQELDPCQVASIIRPCGLSPSKSQAICTLSRILVEKHKGQVPQTFEELESLPGVGHKTASVVLAQAFEIPTFPVDTHIHRCARRWKLSSGKSVVQTERDLKKKFPQESWIRLHLQIILFARSYCPAKKHSLAHCPICRELS